MKHIQSLMLLLLIGLPFGAVYADPDMDDVTMDVVTGDHPDEITHDIDLPDDSDLEGREDHGPGHVDDDEDHAPGHVDDDDRENEDEIENEDDREDEREDGQSDGPDSPDDNNPGDNS